MAEEKNNQKKKKGEECPLCEVSEETIKRLKEAGKNEKGKENQNNDK